MKLTYRPEIDGLRAIAVVAVILYHAQTTILGYQPFKGGFIGVDIFFVISGYLITSIILRELVTTGTFSFKYFYERRIRRILPALLTVMLVSFPFAWIYLLPNSFIDFSKSILYSLGFSSNFYFDFIAQLYNAENSLKIPFLHTWSLSVEEQYYLLFPIIFFIVIRYFNKTAGIILIFGFILSLLASHWGSQNRPYFTFYSLPTRGWELLAGSILAYYEINLGHRSKNQKLNLILPSVGLFFIFHSILFFNDEMFHPSFYTLSPIIGVCLIIWFSNRDDLITKILSSKLFVGIGLISYSLYLWHYPIFAFDRIIEFSQGNITKKILLGIMILLLSIISYYFIERPARNKKNKFKIIISSIVFAYLILIIFNFNVIFKNGFKDRLPDILGKNFQEAPFFLLKNSEGKDCYDNINGCKFNLSSKSKVYVIGDSITASLIFDLKNKIVKKNYQFINFTIAGCLYFPGFNKIVLKTKKVYEKCNKDYFKSLNEIFSKNDNSIIIFGGGIYFHNYLFDQQDEKLDKHKSKSKFISTGKYDSIEESFFNEVLKLSKKNNIILIYPFPKANVNVPAALHLELIKKQNMLTKNFSFENINISYEDFENETKPTFELFNSIKNDNVYRVYPHKLFCNSAIKNRCITHNDKDIFYSDDDHPSYKGAEMINELIMKEIEKIELKSN